MHECTFKDTLPATKIAYSSIALRKDRRNISESRTYFNAKLCNFCKQNNIGKSPKNEETTSEQGRKPFLAKSLLNYVENY